MISTMQRLAAENKCWRRTGAIDRFILWTCINMMVWFSVYEIYRRLYG